VELAGRKIAAIESKITGYGRLLDSGAGGPKRRDDALDLCAGAVPRMLFDEDDPPYVGKLRQALGRHISTVEDDDAARLFGKIRR
jgi:hypothetical protein